MSDTLHPDLFPETLLISREGEHIFTTSLKVAEHFHKQHKNVLRAIENLISGGPDEEFSRLNFEPRNYQYSTGRNQLRDAQMYMLTEEGFALLAMGFSGKQALAWQIKFLKAFREMERQIHALQKREGGALYQLRPPWRPILQHPEMSRKDLIVLTGHKSPGSITACRRRMRQVGLLH